MRTINQGVAVTADVLWQQQAADSVDITKELVAAFRDVGTTETGMVSTFTGQGLYDNWPEEDDDIGGGWSVGAGRSGEGVPLGAGEAGREAAAGSGRGSDPANERDELRRQRADCECSGL